MKLKTTLFISAALTAFFIAVIASVITQVRGIIQAQQTASVEEAAAVVVTAVLTEEAALPTSTSAPTQVVGITPEQAASIAAALLNRQDLYSVESVTIDGLPAYKVTFLTGDVVNVGMDGQVISTVLAQPMAINVNPTASAPEAVQKSQESTSGSQQDEHEDDEQKDDDGHEDDD
jgi:ABC-type amino acid transport substrate-binding protein